jgi:hypothetical protein
VLFGRVVEGLEFIMRLQLVQVGEGDKPMVDGEF